MESENAENGRNGQDNLIKHGREGGERFYQNKFTPLDLSDEEWGKTGREEIQRTISNYPFSHRGNLEELLKSFSEKPEKLGGFLRNNPIISKVEIDLQSNKNSDEISLMFQNEGNKRQHLKEWFDVIRQKFSALTLMLFTDGQEIIVGTSEDRSKKRLSFRKKLNLSLEQIRRRLDILGDLVPKIEIFEDPNRQSLMFEASYIEGRYANPEEIEKFKKKLAEKGLDPSKFDLNSTNLIVDRNGRIYLVDMDDFVYGY